MKNATNSDPLGHHLLRSRLKASLAFLFKQLAHPQTQRTSAPWHAHWIITGVGSSEAHARFLVYLIHACTVATAEYRPLSAFLNGTPSNARHAGLIVFSQGLSPNAIIALRHHRHFAHTVIFSAPLSNLHAEKDSQRACFVEKLIQSHSTTFVPIGEDTERGLLMRVVGPLVAYQAAIDWLHSSYPPGLKPFPLDTFTQVLKDCSTLPLPDNSPTWVEAARNHGLLIIGQSTVIEYAHNLAYKLMEGLFIPQVRLQEALQFAHGPFQAIIGAKKPPVCLLLEGPHIGSYLLLASVRALLSKTQATVLNLCVNLPEPYAIFGYETLLNNWVVTLIEQLGLNQAEWPGKNEDHPIYDIEKTE